MKNPQSGSSKNRKKIFTVTDLGGGDGGKGGIVHGICCRQNAHTVLKVGGAQGSHGVRNSAGESFNFSHFGCGTLEGVRTHILPLMVIAPLGLLNEGNALVYESNVRDAFDLLTLDEDCLCAMPFHGISSRLTELARKERQKGTVGVGVGEAKLQSELFPDLAIFARDLGKPDIRDRIEAQRQHALAQLAPLLDNMDRFWPEDHELARIEIARLRDPGFTAWIAEEIARFVKRVKIVPTDYLEKEVLSKDGVAVVESSHGILTDRYYGFHPYVSRLRTLPQATYDLLTQRGYDGELFRLGITRAYQIRHGAGPLVTEDPDLVEQLLPGSSKDANRWQGTVRVGPLDFVALRYAVEVCGGSNEFDGIAVSWFDQIQKFGTWQTCERYANAENPKFFSPEGEILVKRGEDDAHIEHQRELADVLFGCRPVLTLGNLPETSDRYALGRWCSEVFVEQLHIPIRMMSFGSTELEKAFL